jgi:hypothetical protein
MLLTWVTDPMVLGLIYSDRPRAVMAGELCVPSIYDIPWLRLG